MCIKISMHLAYHAMENRKWSDDKDMAVLLIFHTNIKIGSKKNMKSI